MIFSKPPNIIATNISRFTVHVFKWDFQCSFHLGPTTYSLNPMVQMTIFMVPLIFCWSQTTRPLVIFTPCDMCPKQESNRRPGPHFTMTGWCFGQKPNKDNRGETHTQAETYRSRYPPSLYLDQKEQSRTFTTRNESSNHWC